ncbi:hypothetical protein FCV55_10990 [Vibrio sp. F13]|uniref:hypothetical protein n=1 Tax=Vibrio sp. F13 TaxID=2070777 RepID=UPI0010BDF226|nr:hypothetical protein [Vibrio sp. F13]TKF69777.1 hypothetical protein FCV55_10990 [Vibrio sp. F13]
MFKITGFDEVKKSIDEMVEQIEQLGGTTNIPMGDLLTNDFVKATSNNQDIESFDELLVKGGYDIQSQEDFEAIPDDEFDEFISKNTSFATWSDMLSAATEQYVSNQLKF